MKLRQGFYVVNCDTNEICYGPYELEEDAIQNVKTVLNNPEKYMIARFIPIMIFERCNVITKRL